MTYVNEKRVLLQIKLIKTQVILLQIPEMQELSPNTNKTSTPKNFAPGLTHWSLLPKAIGHIRKP